MLQDREKLLGQILARMGPQEEKTEEVKMSPDEALRIIQVHERARQGRLRAKFMREIRLQEERERNAANRGAPTLDTELAAVRIQKVSSLSWHDWTMIRTEITILSLSAYFVEGPMGRSMKKKKRKEGWEEKKDFKWMNRILKMNW